MVFKSCRDCTERTVEPNCHMTCEKYLAEMDYNELMKNQRCEDLNIQDAIVHSCLRMTRKYRRKKGN